MAFAGLLDAAEIAPANVKRTVTKTVVKKTKGKYDSAKRGCAYCPMAEIEGIHKFKSEIEADRPILVIGHSPGSDDNVNSKPLSGRAGLLFWKAMRAVGLSRRECNIQYHVKCFTANAIPGSYDTYLKARPPSAMETHCCSVYTEEALEQSPAKFIVVLGAPAAKLLLKTRTTITQKIFYDTTLQARVYVVDHPAMFLRGYDQGPRFETFQATLRQLAEDVAAYQGGATGDLSDQYRYVRAQDYRLVTTEAEALAAERIIRKCQRRGRGLLSVDIEDDRFGKTKRDVFACGFSPKPGLSFVFVWRHAKEPLPEGDAVFAVAKRILEDVSLPKAMQFGNSDVTKLWDLRQVRVESYVHDTLLSEWMRFSDIKAYGLDAIEGRRFQQFGGYKSIIVQELIDRARRLVLKDARAAGETEIKLPKPLRDEATLAEKEKYLRKNSARCNRYSTLSLETLRLYNGGDADLTKQIADSNVEHVPQALMSLYIDLSFLLQEMEDEGPWFDFEQHAILETLVPLQEQQLRKELQDMLENPDFNPGSPDQAFEAIYRQLGLEFPLEGKAHTQKAALLLLAREHPFPGKLLEWRSVAKVKSTYLDSYKRVALYWLGRLRTKWAACMPASELVLTNRGYLYVDEVKVGDRIIAHTGRARTVTAAFENGVKALVRVRLSNGLELRTTCNHRYYCENGAWVRADNLRLGDSVVVHSAPERWRTIPGWENYKISTWGRVYGKIARGFLHPNRKPDSGGHLTVGLCKSLKRSHELLRVNGRWAKTPGRGYVGKRMTVHRLMAVTFPDLIAGTGPLIRHLNGFGWDNTLKNLRFGTTQENIADKMRHGTTSPVSLRIVRAIQNAEAYRGIDAVHADTYGIARRLASSIRRGASHRVVAEGKRAKFTNAFVESVAYEAAEMTYGLTVDRDESHVTGGIVTHNTGTRTGRLASGGGRDKLTSTVVNLQNIKKDPQIQNMLVADKDWRKAYDAIERIVARKAGPLLEKYVRGTGHIAALDKASRKQSGPGLEKTKRRIAAWKQWLKDNAELIAAAKSKLGRVIEKWVRRVMPFLKTFLVFDFGQIEVRVAAQLANDKNLIKDCGESDIHTRVGVTLTGWDAERIKNDNATRTLTKNCIAEGSLVLTDRGLVPIQDVTLQMRVWDGVEWVAHEGVIYKGVKEVITWDGLTATPDHMVWDEYGNKITFGQACRERRRLIVTGDKDTPIRYQPKVGVFGDTSAVADKPTWGTAKVYDLVNAGPRHRFTANSKMIANCHFGILFGIAKKNLHAFVVAMSPPDMRGRITREEIDEAYDRYFARYDGVARFIVSQRAFAKENKYVETLFGMRQTLNVIDDDYDNEFDIVDEGGEAHVKTAYWGNQAINGPVQGTAHQLLICALVNLLRQREKYALLGVPPMEVHDALYFNVPVLQLGDAVALGKYLLERESLNTVKSDFPAIKWKVPIAVDSEAGLRLGAKIAVTPETEPGVFLFEWFIKAKAQTLALESQLTAAGIAASRSIEQPTC